MVEDDRGLLRLGQVRDGGENREGAEGEVLAEVLVLVVVQVDAATSEASRNRRAVRVVNSSVYSPMQVNIQYTRLFKLSPHGGSLVLNLTPELGAASGADGEVLRVLQEDRSREGFHVRLWFVEGVGKEEGLLRLFDEVLARIREGLGEVLDGVALEAVEIRIFAGGARNADVRQRCDERSESQ